MPVLPYLAAQAAAPAPSLRSDLLVPLFLLALLLVSVWRVLFRLLAAAVVALLLVGLVAVVTVGMPR